MILIGMEAPDNLSKSFGLGIAFLIPGAVGLYAISFYVPTIESWFGAATDGETTVGGFLFAILGSAGMGVFISGVRWLVLESEYGVRALKYEFAPRPPAGLDLARRRDEKCEAAYQDLLFRHYQFYQFYANMPFALGFLYSAWTLSGSAATDRAIWLAALMSVADLVLLLSARHAIQRYSERLVDLLGIRNAAA
jgi:hypothetical protein